MNARPQRTSSNFSGCLLLQRKSKCQDPRDQVFAVLSLVEPEEREHLLRAFPDYSMNQVQVAIIALAHLKQTGWINRLQLDSRPLEIFEALGLAHATLAERHLLMCAANAFGYLTPSFSKDLAIVKSLNFQIGASNQLNHSERDIFDVAG